MRKVIANINNNQMHWVGDGFPVRNLFSYDRLGQAISPFLLLDYAAPYPFQPTTEQHGVGSHPHRGFETVTIAYSGEVSHRDSSGGGGTIKTGDVQWMTAASGVVHEEFHSADFAKEGGLFEMVQLWVNLPAKDKMTPPKYQGISADEIPNVTLDDEGSNLRVIAGTYHDQAGNDQKGAASTYSPVNMWDGMLKAGTTHRFFVPVTHNAMLVILNGEVVVNGDQTVKANSVAVMARDGEADFEVVVNQDAKFLILTGEPLNEPIEGYGPFVMNTQAEIKQAFVDFQSGKFGEIPTEA